MDYVKNITAAFRQAIDEFIHSHTEYCRSSSGVSEFTFTPDPAKTFNRGYTRYFISGGRGRVASVDTQKSIGRYVGEIAGTGKDFFFMGCHNLQSGDGFCFFTKQSSLAGFRVERVDKEKIYPNNMAGLATGAPQDQ
jgi:putative protease